MPTTPATVNTPNTPAPSGSAVTGANTQNGPVVTLVNPLGAGGTSLPAFLNSILAFVVQIGSIVVVFMLVYVGYKFVAAQGAPDKISEARNMLMWTVIGALVLLGAQAISIGIQQTVSAIQAGAGQ